MVEVGDSAKVRGDKWEVIWVGADLCEAKSADGETKFFKIADLEQANDRA